MLEHLFEHLAMLIVVIDHWYVRKPPSWVVPTFICQPFYTAFPCIVP